MNNNEIGVNLNVISHNKNNSDSNCDDSTIDLFDEIAGFSNFELIFFFI